MNGADFAASGSLIFNFQVGTVTQACIEVDIINDMDLEGDHSFDVTLGANTPALGGGTGVFGSSTSTIVTIQDPEGLYFLHNYTCMVICAFTFYLVYTPC